MKDHCPAGTHFNGHGCENNHITITVHHTGSSGSSGSSNGHYMSDSCYSTIKAAWIAKITRGDNSRMDNIIDNCMGI
jgi:hypothetical protein